MVERAAASIAYYKGLHIRGQARWPALERWFAALEQRPTYMATKSDYYTHCHDLPPQLGGAARVGQGFVIDRVE
jgi:glutathione S-transferase